MSENSTTFGHYGSSFQEKLAFLIFDDRVFSDRMMEVLNIEYFEKKELQVFVEKVFSYKRKYGMHPGYDTIETILRAGLDAENEATQKLVRDFYNRMKIDEKLFESSEYVKEEALDFCRKQKLKEAMIKSMKLLKNHSFDEVGVLINDALKAGADCDFGHDWISDIEKRYIPDNRVSITTGWTKFDNIMKGGHGRGELGVAIAPTGCHAKGTPILMFDGTIKNVEDVIVGDILMGPDSRGRLVEVLHRGREKMFKIKPTKGGSFTVNEGHILSLKRIEDETPESGKVLNISVGEYNKRTKDFGCYYRLYKVPVENFYNENPDKDVVDPYFIGLMIGRDWKNKEISIQHNYKTSSFENRKLILAGLLDANGNLIYDGRYTFTSKSKKLSEDIIFIARSLGISAHYRVLNNVFGEEYYMAHLMEGCSIIPCALKRNKTTRWKETRNHLLTEFTVEEQPEDDYYGFQVSGDNLYLMGDFTVTHNSGKSMVLVHLGATAVKAGLTVVHYTLELKDIVVGQRYDSCITGIAINDLQDNKEKVLQQIKEIDGKLIVKEYPTKTASTNTIRSHLEKLKRQGIVPDMIIVDYADLLKPLSGRKEKRDELESIYEELRAIMQEYNAAGWTASQTNRQGLNSEVVTLDSISEAFNKCFIADFIFTVSRNHDDKRNNTGRCLVAKNRNGGDGFVFDMMMDTSNVDIKIIGHHNFKNNSYNFPQDNESQKRVLQDEYASFVSKKTNKHH